MHSANHWGGTFEIAEDEKTEHNDQLERSHQHHNRTNGSRRSHELDSTQQSWLLAGPQDKREMQRKKYVDLGCILCSRKALKWSFWGFLVAFCVIALPIIISKSMPTHKAKPIPPDSYTLALNKALLFFNAQKSGKLPSNNGIPWRGNSGLSDGNGTTDTKGGLVGGYYDAGDNTKFHFPMAFAMSMLSWSVIEYSHKYEAINELDHIHDLIKWGTDYLLLTFNSSAEHIDKVYSQVGGSRNGSSTPDDHFCWQKPEDMDYPRPIQIAHQAPDLAAEMAAALASASIVFKEDVEYSKKLSKGAEALFEFARDKTKRQLYSKGNDYIEAFYNSTGYFDEFMWSAAWLYYATGNATYIGWATNRGFPQNANAFYMIPDLSVLSWDNKLPAAMLLLTRLRIFLSPGYPYEDMLRSYHNVTTLTMCSYLRQYRVFNWTDGGMIELNHGRPQPLQYVANAVFLASLFADYLNAASIPGFTCGQDFILSDKLQAFATGQMDYILGKNPMNTSYVVGYGNIFPIHVHHRGASIPRDNKKYSCEGGYKWRDSRNANPHNITGAMVGGPDQFDMFKDVRSNYSYTEPTLAGNAGLVAALVSLTTTAGHGIDKNTIFAAIPPLFPGTPPPPPPWKP